MEYYNESAYEIDCYVKGRERCIPASDIKKSLFLGMHPFVTPKLDKNDPKKLADGTHGLPGDRRCGWVIIPGEKRIIDLPVKGLNASRAFHVSFLSLPHHRIYTPQQVQLLEDGVAYKTIGLEPEDSPEKGEMMKATVPADLNGTEQLSIKISCLKKPGAQMGIDEITFIP